MNTPESILLVSDFAFPVSAGTERLVFGLAEDLNEKGIKTDILTPNWKNLIQKEKVNKTTIYRFNTHSIYKPEPIKRIYGFVKKGMKLEKYDIYHGFYTVPPNLSAIFLAKLQGKKSITTYFSTQQIENNLNNPVKNFFLLNMLNKADLVTAYTWRIKKIFEEKYFKGKEINVTQGWVETGFKKIDAQKKTKEKIILFTGRLSKQKGAFVLIKAFSEVQKKVNDTKLVFAGMPLEKKEAAELIKKLGLKKVEIKGFVSEKELNELYNSCDVVAVPGFEDYGIGLSLMEATFFEKPIISCYGLGIKNEALVVEPGNEKELADKLIRLLSDKKFYEEQSRNAKEISKLFEKKNVIKNYLKTYEKVMQK
ncbi:glycosyltransferase family 4 protein [Candidatus Micrarchaeota archaeon]|nr:glycosyltransferase family 4 protein [Candidatus Micrarchaeota archaeon]MBU2476717.1 glycosyltransferase family 4 protein [Candidatus Micrarchaeota archaeon]